MTPSVQAASFGAGDRRRSA